MRVPWWRRKSQVERALDTVARLSIAVDQLRVMIGRAETRRVRGSSFASVQEAEFQVFSQWGEDGILQYLLGRVPVERNQFVEIGVEDYSESNTRFLLQNDGWQGVVIDSGSAAKEFLRTSGLDWRHDIRAVEAFVTRENVNEILAEAGVHEDLGILSIDVDGNDYWILEAVTQVRPRILVVEYNSVFGPDAEISVPYDPGFVRTRAHPSNLYFGASLRALAFAAKKKGFRLVGSNSAGCNAFFVREDLLGGLRPLEPAEAWVRSRFREARDARGNLTLEDSHIQGIKAIHHMPVVEVATGKIAPLKDALAAAQASKACSIL